MINFGRTSQRRLARGAAVGLMIVCGLPLVLPPIGLSQDLERAYRQIKDLEGHFPIPTPYATVKVGVFDVATGRFDGLVSTTEMHPPDELHRRPYRVTLPAVREVNAVHVGLVFEVRNSPGGFQVTANGVTTASTGQESIEVNVASASLVNWTIRAGAKTHSDKLLLQRPPIIGAGAFTVPALPIAIVYEPPQDAQRLNRASYSVATSIGNTMSTSLHHEQSVTRPAHTDFDDVMRLKQGMEAIAFGLDKAKAVFPGAGEMAAGLRGVAGALGTASATWTQGTAVTEDHRLAMRDAAQTTSLTGEHEGPGVGDRIIYLKDARLVWLAESGKLRLALLGYSSVARETVRLLKAELQEITSGAPVGPRTGHDRATIEALLALDPFVAGGPRALLPPPRFWLEGTREGSGGTDVIEWTHEVQTGDLTASATFGSQTEDYHAGLLGFVGIGAPETKSLKVTGTHTSSNQVAQGLEVKVSVELHAQGLEHWAIEAWYDRVFGTFAFREVGTGSELVAGVAVDLIGRPLTGKRVALVASRDTISITRTDQQGRYSFRATTIRPGRLTVVTEGVRRPIELKQGRPALGVDLRVPLRLEPRLRPDR